MKNLVQKIPFLRITLAFAVGIYIASKVSLSFGFIIAGLVLLFGSLVLLYRKYVFRSELIVGWIITLFFVFLGAGFSSRYNQLPDFPSAERYCAIVLETPEEKENSYKTILQLNNCFYHDSVAAYKEQVLTYFEKNEQVSKLGPGDEILIEAAPRLVQNNGNPFEFDYKSYLFRKKIYRQLYLPVTAWKSTHQNKNTIQILAEKTREKLLNIYRRQNLGENETEILSALTLGYKRGLDPETKRIFSAAGAMHVLAVSGLHVGILFGLFTLLFGFLQKKKTGKIIFVVGALLFLWGYAFLTGLSPSVMRAATMFSMICIGTNLKRRASIYNSLAFAAFLLLIINPNNLFEVGFQLSFSAVFGIVFLQPRLAKLWPVKNVVLKWMWMLLTVSLAAQIATFPLTAYYFNQFPTYFLLSNLVVIPAAVLMIWLGIGMLVFSGIPMISGFLAFLTKWLIGTVYTILSTIENLPFSVLNIGIDLPHTILLVLILLSLFSFIANKHIRTLKSPLFLSLLFVSLSFILRLNQLTHSEFIAYNNSENPVIHLINGTENYVISEFPMDRYDYIYRDISNVKIRKHLEEPLFLTTSDQFENGNLYMRNGTVVFQNKIIQFDGKAFNLPPQTNIDYLVSRKSRFLQSNTTTQAKSIISFSKYVKTDSLQNIYPVIQNGAFHNAWRTRALQTKDH